MAWIPGARVQGGVLLLRGGPGDLPERGEDGELAWGQRACGGHPVVVKPALILTTTLRVLLHWPKDSAGILFTDGASAVGRAPVRPFPTLSRSAGDWTVDAASEEELGAQGAGLSSPRSQLGCGTAKAWES